MALHLLALHLVAAFTTTVRAPPTRPLRSAPAVKRARAAAAHMCICINCRWVDRCTTYHWVETQHDQAHLTLEPDFDPTDPRIQVFIRSDFEDEEEDEGESGGVAAESVGSAATAGDVAGSVDAGEDGKGSVDAGVQLLDGPSVTTEFDVYACDAFTEDGARWIRLMRGADFVPT